MDINIEDIEILIKAAGVEIATAPQSFSEHIADIELYFDLLKTRSGLQFELLSPPSPSSDRVIYETTLGIFDFTPQIGKLLVPNGDAKPTEVSFFSGADVTASLISAAVRFTERRLAYVKNKGAKPDSGAVLLTPYSQREEEIFLGRPDIKILIEAAGVEIASAQRPFSEHIAASEAYFRRREQRMGSEFKFDTTDAFFGGDPSTDHVKNITSLGTFDLTPQIGKLIVPQDNRKAIEVPFFSAADETVSLVSAVVRFTERRLDFVRKQQMALVGVGARL